jgi:long-chain acyl-CoA synthetase
VSANLKPFQGEIRRYHNWARPFQPIRILNLFPMSHMYGQALGLFIPLLLEGAVVFMEELSPAAIIQRVRRERVSVLVAVARLVRSLQDQLERTFDLSDSGIQRSGLMGLAQRWWHYRPVHRALGWKFWSIVVGGGPLDSGSEAFWRELGVLVLQGYGLTEASPVVTVNHPFNARQGSIGRVLKGQEVRIAPDGEILALRDSVTDQYLGSAGPEKVCRDGWFHAGDLGELDSEGFLYFRGRKKDVIVSSEGLNIHPQDVESVLNSFPEVQQGVVVGLVKENQEEIHATLIVQQDPFDVDALIARANQQLEPHQRIRSWSFWPEEEFPHTPSTLKIQRHEVARQLSAAREGNLPALPKSEARKVKALIAEIAGKDPAQLEKGQRLSEDLGLSSLEQLDLLSQLERKAGVALEEEQFTALRTIGEIDSWLKEETTRAASPVDNPRARAGPAHPHWNQFVAIWRRRRLGLQLVILPLFKHFIGLTVRGLEHLEGLHPPVIFVANHVSQLDTPTLPRDGGGLRQTLQSTGWLIEQGNCPLVYPEGKRSPDGTLLPFQNGIGFMVRRLQMAVVPVHLEGLYDIFPVHYDWPQRGEVRVRIGFPLHFGANQDYEEIAKKVETAVRALKRR